MWAGSSSNDEAAHVVELRRPGTMGYSIPAAMGAKMADPDLEVWAVDGLLPDDQQELATCAIEGIPIKVALINNGNLGMVRQWQTFLRGALPTPTSLRTRAASPTS